MKKNKLLLMLMASLFMVSCNNEVVSSNSPSSESKPSSSIVSSTVSSVEPLPEEKEYKFEAENAKLKGGTKGALSIENTGLNGETFVGNFSDNVGASIIYKIIADQEGDVNFTCNLSKSNDTRIVTDFVVILVNDDIFETEASVTPLKEGEKEWFSFEKVNMGKVHLIEGENIIEFAMYQSNVGFSMDSISLYTNTITLTEGVWEQGKAPTIDENKSIYRYEAEDSDHHSSLTIETLDNASGGKILGGIANMAGDNPGEGYITFNINSNKAGKGNLLMSLALPNGNVSINGFTITVNGNKVTPEIENIVPYTTGYETGWFNYALCSVCELFFNEGDNELKFVINQGAVCNIDYIEINTDLVLNGTLNK